MFEYRDGDGNGGGGGGGGKMDWCGHGGAQACIPLVMGRRPKDRISYTYGRAVDDERRDSATLFNHKL